MRLYCVTTEYHHHYGLCPIEVGRTYEVCDVERTWEDDYKKIYIWIESKSGDYKMELAKANFIPLEQIRNKAIDDILNDGN